MGKTWMGWINLKGGGHKTEEGKITGDLTEKVIRNHIIFLNTHTLNENFLLEMTMFSPQTIYKNTNRH